MFKTIIETIFFYSVFFGLIYTLKYAHAINQLIIELKSGFWWIKNNYNVKPWSTFYLLKVCFIKSAKDVTSITLTLPERPQG